MTPIGVTGAAMTAAILDAARLGGWRVHHQRPGRTTHGWRTAISGDAGFPDVMIAKVGQPVLALELKGSGDRVRPGQREWLEALDHAPVIAGIVTPAELRLVTVALLGRATVGELAEATRGRVGKA